MKKLLLVAALVLGTIACEKYDDTELKDSIVNLQGQINGNKAQIAQLSEANATLQAALAAGDTAAAEALTNAIAELQSAIASGDAEGQALAAQLLDAAINSVNGDIAALALRIESLEGTVKSLEDAVVSYEDISNVPDIAALIAAAVEEAKQFALDSELFEADTNNNEAVAALESALATLDKLVKDNASQWSTQTVDTNNDEAVALLITQLGELATKLSILEGTSSEALESNVKSILDMITELQTKVDANSAAIAALGVAVAKLQSSVASLTATVDAIDFVDDSELATELAIIVSQLEMYADLNDDNTEYDFQSLVDGIAAVNAIITTNSATWAQDNFEANTDNQLTDAQVQAIMADIVSEIEASVIAAIETANAYADTVDTDTHAPAFDATELLAEIQALKDALAALDAEVVTDAELADASKAAQDIVDAHILDNPLYTDTGLTMVVTTTRVDENSFVSVYGVNGEVFETIELADAEAQSFVNAKVAEGLAAAVWGPEFGTQIESFDQSRSFDFASYSDSEVKTITVVATDVIVQHVETSDFNSDGDVIDVLERVDILYTFFDGDVEVYSHTVIGTDVLFVDYAAPIYNKPTLADFPADHGIDDFLVTVALANPSDVVPGTPETIEVTITVSLTDADDTRVWDETGGQDYNNDGDSLDSGTYTSYTANYYFGDERIAYGGYIDPNSFVTLVDESPVVPAVVTVEVTGQGSVAQFINSSGTMTYEATAADGWEFSNWSALNVDTNTIVEFAGSSITPIFEDGSMITLTAIFVEKP